MNPVIPIKSNQYLANRSTRRPFLRYGTEIMINLERINSNFLIDLFGDNKLSYTEIYNFYHAEWLKSCKIISSWTNLVTIDSLWFENNYKPVEAI